MARLGLIVCIVWVGFTGCTVMDDNSIPQDQYKLVEISEFEVNMDRNFIRGRLQNSSTREISSSIFKFKLYSVGIIGSEARGVMDQALIQKYSGGDSLDLSSLLLSQNFVVREPLKPGYSTEFYFELMMDYESSEFLYTLDIVQLKGPELAS